jgi:hypothetical protein
MPGSIRLLCLPGVIAEELPVFLRFHGDESRIAELTTPLMLFDFYSGSWSEASAVARVGCLKAGRVVVDRGVDYRPSTRECCRESEVSSSRARADPRGF